MESIWLVFKTMHEKVPFSTGCRTPLSNFEAGLNYKDVDDHAVTVSFPVIDPASSDSDLPPASFIAWTTTPWTLPSNLELCVNPQLNYVYVIDDKTQNVYVLAESRLVQLYENPKKKKGFEILKKFKGSELTGMRYEPCLLYTSPSPRDQRGSRMPSSA